MNLRDLEYFYHLSLIKSYTGAAQHFHVSQPTVSYAVKRLEEELGCDLVIKDSSHRTVVLTVQGDIFAHHIEEVLLHVRLGINEVKQSLKPQLTIGFPPIIGNYLMSKLVNASKDLSVFSHFKTIRGGSKSLLIKLLNGQLDFSLLGSLSPLSYEQLDITPLFKQPLYLVLSPEHPLANEKELAFKDVVSEKFILLDEHNTHLAAFKELNQRYQNKAVPFFEIDDVSVIKQMVSENLGISLLSDIALGSDNHHLVKIPLAKQDRIDFHVSYAYSKHSVLAEPVKKLITLLDSVD